MKTSSKIMAFLSYLFLVPGWLIALIFFRKDDHVKFHAKQSFVLNLLVLLLLVVWFVLVWLLIGIPIIGPIIGWFSFAILIAAYIFALIIWITGMIHSFRSKSKPLAIIGTWAARIPV